MQTPDCVVLCEVRRKAETEEGQGEGGKEGRKGSSYAGIMLEKRAKADTESLQTHKHCQALSRPVLQIAWTPLGRPPLELGSPLLVPSSSPLTQLCHLMHDQCLQHCLLSDAVFKACHVKRCTGRIPKHVGACVVPSTLTMHAANTCTF